MCHENLRVELHPNVNVIVGQNGSGKSALLTAIMLCLGGKPRATSRALNIASLVQEGKTKSILSVTLRNTLPDAYRHDLYGERITVERTITINPADRKKATSVFAIKGENGKIVERGAEEVHELCERFGISTENPINVMTQEMSKEFLGSADDAKRFQLFAQVTMVDFIESALHQSENSIAQVHDLADKAEEHLRKQYKELMSTQALMNKLTLVDKLKDEQLDVIAEIAWAQVAVTEGDVAVAQEVVTKLEATAVPKTELQIEKHKEKVAECSEKVAAAQQKFDAFAQRAEEHNKRIKEAGLAVKMAEQGLMRPKAALDRITRTRAKSERERQSLQTQASQVQETATQATQKVRHEREQAIATAQEGAGVAKKEVAKWEQSLQEAQAQLDDANRQLAEHQEAVSRAQNELAGLQRELNHLTSQQKNKDAAFGGEQILTLLRAIEQHRGHFRHAPVGPIGKYLTLKDARWARAVEAVAGRQFDAFLVNDWNDHRTLTNIIKEQQRAIRGFRPPTVIVYPLEQERYTLPEHRLPSRELLTVYNMLESDNSAVINVLIDYANIERVVLSNSLEEAKVVAWDKHGRYPNVKEAYLEDGEKIYARGGVGAAAGNITKFARLGVNVDAQIRDVKAEVDRAKERVTGASKQKAALEDRQKRAAADVRNIQRSLQGARQSLKRAEEQLLRAQHTPVEEDELAAGGGEDDTRLLEEEIARIGAQLKELESEEAEAKHQLAAEQAKLSAAQARLDEVKAESGDIHAEERAIDKEMDEANGGKQQVEKALEHYVNLLAQYKRDLIAARAKLADAEAKYKAKLEATLEECPENPLLKLSPIPNILRFLEGKQRKLEHLKKQIRQEESRVCGEETREQLEARAASQEQAYKRLKDDTGMAFRVYQDLSDSLEKRRSIARSKFSGLATQISHKFNSFMNSRGFAGQIKINWADRTLELSVNMGKDKGMQSSTKTLSGGEKSFTTLSFLLALGQENDCPFRCADEFDIFMDSVTRRKSLETLVAFAQENSHIQFVFLTPNEISEIQVNDLVKVQRMKRPRE